MINNTYPSTSDDVPISTGHVLVSLVVLLSLVFPSLSLITPHTARAIETKPQETDEFVIEFTTNYDNQLNFDVASVDTPDHWNPLFTKLMRHYVEENEVTNPEWPELMESFLAMTSHIESDNKRSAYNKSGAMSYYQFKGPSLQTAYVRLKNYLYRHELGRTTAWSKRIANQPRSIYEYPKDKQAVFVLANILGLDKKRHLLADFLNGDTEVAKTIYYKYHHTRPGASTKKRTNRLFAQYFSTQLAMN